MSDGSDSDDTPPTYVRLEDENSDDDPEWEDPSGGALSSILDACERGGNAEALSALLGSLDVSVDTKGADGDTPLHVACLYGHADIVRALLEANADPRVTDGDGGTPLHDASAGGHLNIVKMLVERSSKVAPALTWTSEALFRPEDMAKVPPLMTVCPE